jgi:hypothetical protein
MKILLNPSSLVAFLCLFLLSCEENETEITYPRNFESSLVGKAGLRLFTSQGEITDEAVRNDFFSRYSEYINDVDDFGVEDQFSFTYLSQDEVEINKYFTLEDEVTNVQLISGVEYWETEIYTKYNWGLALPRDILKHKPITITPFPEGSNQFQDYAKFCLYVKNEGDRLKLPMIDLYNVAYVHQINDTEFNYVYTINNELNELEISNIRETDTLMTQEYYVEFKLMP